MVRSMSSSRRRELIVVIALTMLFGGGIVFFLLLIGGWFFLSVLLALAISSVLFWLHYATWGRSLEEGPAGPRRARRGRRLREPYFPFSDEVTTAERAPRTNDTPPGSGGV